MKYKIIKSDLFLNGKVIPENSEVDLSENDIKGIEKFLIRLQDNPEQKKESINKRGNK